MTRAETARQAAIDRVGDAYVYGAWDQFCTVANRNRYANLNAEYRDAIKNQCQRTKSNKNTCSGCKYEGRRIHDCRGLTSTCAKAAGIVIDGQTVARQWNADVWVEKGPISTLPKGLPYVQLFRHNGTKWTHTGCYIGNEETVDARGHASGVVRCKLTAYAWTHWAVPKGMYDQAEAGVEGSEKGEGWSVTEYHARVKVKSGRLNMRSGPGTEHGVVERLPDGTPLVVIAEFDTDGDGKADWAFVDEDGVQGYVSMAYIEREAPLPAAADISPASRGEGEGAETPPPDSAGPGAGYAVWIPCENEEEARRYAGNIKNAVVIRYEKPPGDAGGEGE